MPFSPDGSMFLLYPSYDESDFDNYYEHQAEIYFYRITKEQGLKGLQFIGSHYTKDWSIEEICWADANYIILKLYQGIRSGDLSKLDYQHFKARIQ